MKTEVIMKRKLFGMTISQRSKSEFFSATDLVKAGNFWRLSNELSMFDLNNYLNTKSAKEFIGMLEEKYGKVKINARGKGQHTWVHPLLFIDIALSIGPKLKLEVYDWLLDHLLKYRNGSGDSYKKMAGALYVLTSDKRRFGFFIAYVENKIKRACNVDHWNSATEEQLSTRDKIHDAIFFISGIVRDRYAIVDIGIAKALEYTL